MDSLEPKESTLEVLRAMERASEVFSRCMGRPNVSFDVEDWSIGKTFGELIVERPSASAISQLSSDCCRLEYIIQLSKHLTVSASKLFDLLQRKMKPLSLALSKGINSIPNELLASIFKFATLDERKGTCRMIWLSHVSRRFRGVCLGNPRLWTDVRLRESLTKERTTTFISRSGKDTDLHITFNYSGDLQRARVMNEELAEAWSPSISRWRWLSLLNDCDIMKTEWPIGCELDGLMRRHSLILPRLRSLSLSQCHWPMKCEEEPPWFNASNHLFALTQPCEMPNLRILRCIQHIPPTSFPFTSLTSFELSLMILSDDIAQQTKELVEFVSLQPNISVMEIELDFFDGADYWDCVEILDFSVAVCPNVTVFKLKIINTDLITDNDDSVVWSILRLLRMPRLETFSLSLDIQSGWVPAKHGEDRPFCVYTDELVPEPEGYPHLTSVTFNMPVPRVDGVRSHTNTEYIALFIPIDSFPRATMMYITTFARIHFYRRASPQGIQVSRLEELHLRSCENLAVGGLREMVQSLKSVDAWENLERVCIQECPSLDYNSAVEVIGEERLHFEG